MKDKIQVAADLLRAYFREMPEEIIQADWEAVKDLEIGGPTIEELLAFHEKNEAQSITYNPDAFEWQESLRGIIGCNEIDYDVVLADFLQIPQEKISQGLDMLAGNTQYAMAA